MTAHCHVVIVGGGAAGMTAAIASARAGARVTVLERQERVGRKLLATGNGRCNLGNVDNAASHYRCGCLPVVESVLSRFTVAQTVEFFEESGLLVREEEGRLYPATGQASTVLDILRLEAQLRGVTVRTGADVKTVVRRGDGLALRLPDSDVRADRVVLCAGGKAAPRLGGTDSGLAILRDLGHTITAIAPALVPLKVRSRFLRHLKGIRLIAGSRLEIEGRAVRAEEGEIQFTEYGLSGIPVLQHSLAVPGELLEERSVTISVDLFPLWSLAELSDHLRRRCSGRPGLTVGDSLVGLAHKRVVQAVLDDAGLAPTLAAAGALDGDAIEALARRMKNWIFPVTGALSWNDAQVMAGGADLSEFASATLESRMVKGLYAAGEVLDVAGECGGYNLQWAWSSGHVAGSCAAAG